MSSECLGHVVHLRTECLPQGIKRECTRGAELVGVGSAGCAQLESLGQRSGE